MPDRRAFASWSTSSSPPIAELRPASGQLHHDVLGVGRACRQPVVPGAQVLEVGPFDIERQPAVGKAADRDVAHGEVLARDIAAVGQMSVEAAEQLADIYRRLLDR